MPIGRPPIGPRVYVRFPPELREELDEWSAASGLPIAELIRRAIERERARIAALPFITESDFQKTAA